MIDKDEWFTIRKEKYKWVEDLKTKNNMTPKEKAKELFTNYLILFPEFYNDLEYGYNEVKAKQCALITVDEILKAIPDSLLDVWQGETYLCINDDIDYWKKVKQEIEKL